MIIKASTTDQEIAMKYTDEEVLAKFHVAKAHSNRWSAESDRLRKYIQNHIGSGHYGAFILEKKEGTPRVSATKAGNAALQGALVIDIGLLPPKFKAGTQVIVIDLNGEEIATGELVANDTLFNKKPPIMVNLTEVPNDESLTP
jgi:hypothetical protein